MENYAYLGTGVKWPISLVSGRAELVSGVELINQSIMDILQTPVGTRFFLPEYGSRISRLLFEPSNNYVAGMMPMLIAEALGQWEKRIRVIEEQITCDFDPDNGLVNVTIMYEILPSNEIRSFIYPFYRRLEY